MPRPQSTQVWILLVVLGGCSETLTSEGPDAQSDMGLDGSDGGTADAGTDPDLSPSDPDVQPDAPRDTGRDRHLDLASDLAPDLPPGPTTYVTGRVHSLLTPAVVRSLEAIAARGSEQRDQVFMKVGDSISVANPFLHCLADDGVDWQGRTDLQATRDFFTTVDDLPGASTSFDRESLSTLGGRTAAWAVTPDGGGPAPVVAERTALAPRFAVVMLGTNDIGFWPEDFPRMFQWYGEHMLELMDELSSHGVIPILSSVPPRLDSPGVLDRRVASMNALVWGLAQSWQVPFVDYHLALEPLAPDWGLAGDGVHPTVACDGETRCGCRFDETGMQAGYNVRNWITLEALDRVRRALLDGEPAPDQPQRTQLVGSGTSADPFVIDQLPFADYRDTTGAPGDALDEYTGCMAEQDESGPEWIYALELEDAVDIGALVVDRAGVDVDVHILSETADTANCVRRNNAYIEHSLGPGRYLFALDTWVDSAATPRVGPYLFVVLQR